MAALLKRLQLGLERLYRIDTRLEIRDFILDAEARRHFAPRRRPREQLLLSEARGELEVGLFVDPAALDNLSRHDPVERLHDGNFGDFLLAIEGVSHFVYLVWRASADRPVSALELELQAEIDKYVTCLLTVVDSDAARATTRLRRRLFEEFTFHDDLNSCERQRYLAANENARRYSASLERRYVDRQRIAEMLGELRHFYRMSLAAKLEFIARAA